MAPVQVTIEEVERCVPREGLIAHFGVDAPVATGTAHDQSLLVAGWVLGAGGVRVRCVQVFHQGELIKRAPVNVPRPDVLATLQKPGLPSDRIGFHFEVGMVGLAERFVLEIEVLVGESVEQATSVRVCMVTGRKASYLALEGRYRPLQVTALGRSGTTLLMGALAQHPEVLVTNFYPYELGQANYWLHMLMVASAPADFEASAHPDQFAMTRYHVGHNPYSHPSYVNQYSDRQGAKRYYTDSTFRALAEFCIGRIDEYYDFVAGQETKPGATIFAEKVVPGPLQNICRDVYRSPKEILLTRDFRDVLCSAKSFNAKRNDLSFGRDRVSDDFQWIDTFFAPGARKLYEAWQQRRDSTLLLRYEDLIRDPLAEIRRVVAYLGVDDDIGVVRRIVASAVASPGTVNAHSTAASPEASIGRWKQELPAELQVHFSQRLGPVFEAFGYE